MPRYIDSSFKEHFGEDVTTIAECWRIQRKDGKVFNFTSHDVDLLINGELYQGSGLKEVSSFSQQADASVSNMSVDVLLDSDDISEIDIETGLFDSATVEIFLVNYSDLSQEPLIVMKGEFGEAEIKDHVSSIELRGLAQKLQQVVGRLHTNKCDADLGDSRCGIDLDKYCVSGEVSLVVNRGKFADSSLSGESVGSVLSGEFPDTLLSGELEDFFKYGTITFDSGLNEGRTFEIKGFSANIPIKKVDLENNCFGLYGNELLEFSVGNTFEVTGSSGNDGTYTLSSKSYDEEYGYMDHKGKHEIIEIRSDGISVQGDPFNLMSGDEDDAKIEEGDTFDIEGSPIQDGTYTVRGASYSSDDIGKTVINTEDSIDVPRYEGITYICPEETIPSSVADGSVLYDKRGMFYLFLPAIYKVNPGDKFRAFPGCSKYKKDCKEKFENVVNFRGFDMIPGRDRISKIGGRDKT